MVPQKISSQLVILLVKGLEEYHNINIYQFCILMKCNAPKGVSGCCMCKLYGYFSILMNHNAPNGVSTKYRMVLECIDCSTQ